MTDQTSTCHVWLKGVQDLEPWQGAKSRGMKLPVSPQHSDMGEESEETTDSDSEDVTWSWQCQHGCKQLRKIQFLAIAWVLGSFKHIINPSIPYITNSFFAIPHGGGDCERFPKSHPCQQGATDAAFWHSIAEAISHLFAMPTAIALGSLSDHVGRLPFVKAAALLSAVVLGALAAHVQFGVTLWVYLVANPLVEAFDCNGVFVAIMLDVQHIIPEQRERTAAWSMFAVLFVPLLVAQMVAGFLIPRRHAMTVALLFTGAHLLWVCFAYPETAKLASGKQKVHVLTVFRDVKRVFLRNTFIQRMALIVALGGFSSGGQSIILPPLMTGRIGVRKADKLIMALCVAPVVLLWVAGAFKFTSSVGVIRVLQFGSLSSACLPLALVFCQEMWQVVVVLVLLLGPAVVTFVAMIWIKSALVKEDEQGTVQGATAGVAKGAATCGLLFFGWQFRTCTHGGEDLEQGALVPFVTNAAVAFLSFVIACTLPQQIPVPDKAENGLELVTRTPSLRDGDEERVSHVVPHVSHVSPVSSNFGTPFQGLPHTSARADGIVSSAP